MWETGVISRILRKVALNPHIDKGCDYSHTEDENLDAGNIRGCSYAYGR